MKPALAVIGKNIKYRRLQRQVPMLAAAPAVFLFSTIAAAQVEERFKDEHPSFDEHEVDVSSGFFSKSFPLVRIGDPESGGLQYVLIYNENYGWSDNFSSRLVYIQTSGGGWETRGSFGSQQVVFSSSAGSSLSFNKTGVVELYNANGTKVVYPYQVNQIVVPEAIVWTQNDGTRLRFILRYGPTSTYYPGNGEYMVDTVARPSGEIYKFHYKVVNNVGGLRPTRYRLQSITNNYGYQLKFEHKSNNFSDGLSFYEQTKVTAINNGVEACDPIANSCDLTGNWPVATFTGSRFFNGEISQGGFQNAAGESVAYNFVKNSQTASYDFKFNGSTEGSLSYYSNIIPPYVVNNIVIDRTTDFRVSSVNDHGVLKSYSYTDIRNSGGARIGVNLVATPADDTIWRYETSNSLLKTAVNGSGNTTDFTYYWLRPALTTLSEGNALSRAYDDRGNMIVETRKGKPVSGVADETVTFTYPTSVSQSGYSPSHETQCDSPVSCNKPASIRDGRNQTTEFEYSPSHGGLLKHTFPADAFGIRAQRRYAYGQLYTWTKNGPGYVRATTPVWRILSEEFCRTSAADAAGNCAAGATDEVTKIYEYEQGSASAKSNLLLLGEVVIADGQTLRTCYGYDQRGRKISETAPAANLSSCS